MTFSAFYNLKRPFLWGQKNPAGHEKECLSRAIKDEKDSFHINKGQATNTLKFRGHVKNV